MGFCALTKSLDTSASLLWDGLKTVIKRSHLFPKCVHCEGLLTDQAVTTTWIGDHLQILHKLGDLNRTCKQSNKIKREKQD